MKKNISKEIGINEQDPHFKAFGMINLQCEIRIGQKFLIKQIMTKASQDINLNYIHLLNHFYEYHTEKSKNGDITRLILKVLP